MLPFLKFGFILFPKYFVLFYLVLLLQLFVCLVLFFVFFPYFVYYFIFRSLFHVVQSFHFVLFRVRLRVPDAPEALCVADWVLVR